MPRPNRSPDRSPGSRRKQKSFRRGDTPRDRRPREADEAHGPEERLQKVLASMGVGSRRDCEEFIKDGRVEVDKQVVTVLGTKVDPFKHEIRVDGELLKKPERMYFAVNKPDGVVTTNFDPSGRERVIDLVPTDARLFAVGRLDRSSEGLILLTNDGEFANRLTHPRYGVEKTYLVRVAGEPGEEKLNKLRRGIHLSDGVCRVQRIVIKGRHKQSTDMIMVLNEGRNREIRRILARVGHKVLKLRRVGIGHLKLGDLPIGAWRKLTSVEVEGLLRETRKQGSGARSQESDFKASGGRKPPDTKANDLATDAGGRGEWIVDKSSPQMELPKHSVMPSLSGSEDDGDFDVDDFAGVSDEDMVDISGFAEEESAGQTPPGEVLDFGEEGEEGELGVEDLAEESDEELPPQGKTERPPRRSEQRPPRDPRSDGPPRGKRPFKKKRFERGSGRPDTTADRGGGSKFAPKAAGKGGRKFRPKGEGTGEQGGGYSSGRPRGAKFGGGPGKKFGGKPGSRAGGKPFGKPAGKSGGKKRFKPKGKGRP